MSVDKLCAEDKTDPAIGKVKQIAEKVAQTAKKVRVRNLRSARMGAGMV